MRRQNFKLTKETNHVIEVAGYTVRIDEDNVWFESYGMTDCKIDFNTLETIYLVAKKIRDKDETS